MAYSLYQIFSSIKISSFLIFTITILLKDYNCLVFKFVNSLPLNSSNKPILFLQIILLLGNNQISIY